MLNHLIPLRLSFFMPTMAIPPRVPPDYIQEKQILMAFKMNNVTLPSQRGFPFQLVAESK